MVTQRYVRNLWDGRQTEVLESPALASPWSCDVDHVVDDMGALNGIAIGFASFGASIGQSRGRKLE